MLIGGPYPIDLAATHWLQSWQSPPLTTFMTGASWLTLVLLYGFLPALAIFWFFNRSQRPYAILIVWIMAGNILTPILQNFFSRPRPDPDQVAVLQHLTAYSFPSGHSIGVVLLTGAIIALSLRTRWRGLLVWLSVIFMMVVGWSRIYLGVHWLTDVMAGYIVGGLWLLIIFDLIWPRIIEHFEIKKDPLEVLD